MGEWLGLIFLGGSRAFCVVFRSFFRGMGGLWVVFFLKNQITVSHSTKGN